MALANLSLRGLVERTKQRFRVGERTFKPTPNVRCPAMLEEARDFEVHMLAFRAALSKYEKLLSAFLAAVPVVARGNLPRAWDAVEGTNMCEPVPPDIPQPHAHRAGGDFDELLMVDAAEILRRRIDGILRPIDRWTESLVVVRARLTRLEALRMQVDARRRRLHKKYVRALRGLSSGAARAIQAQEEAARMTPGAPPPVIAGPAAGEASSGEEEVEEAEATEARSLSWQREREDSAREALSQQRQLEAVTQTYREAEQLVYEQLSGLVRDAAYFKSYIAAALLVIKDSLQATLVALGAVKRPLPGFSEREPAGAAAAEYGRLSDISDLIAGLPPAVVSGGRTVAGAEAGASTAAIRPTRLTAQPLQVAADDVSPATAKFQPVPDVQEPAIGGAPTYPYPGSTGLSLFGRSAPLGM